VNRRTALKVVAGGLVGGGAGVAVLTTAFRPEIPPAGKPKELGLQAEAPYWPYTQAGSSRDGQPGLQSYDAGAACMPSSTASSPSWPQRSACPMPLPDPHDDSTAMAVVGRLRHPLWRAQRAASLIGLFVSDKEARDALNQRSVSVVRGHPAADPQGRMRPSSTSSPTVHLPSHALPFSTTCWAQASDTEPKALSGPSGAGV
jgi:hypothetical protein